MLRIKEKGEQRVLTRYHLHKIILFILLQSSHTLSHFFSFIALSQIIRPALLLPAGFEIETAELFDISFPQPVFLKAT